MPNQLNNQVEEQLDELLTHKRIVPSQSPWSSPIVLARKKDGAYRLCIDYRKLNQITVKDAQPLPRVMTLLRHLMVQDGSLAWIWHQVTGRLKLLERAG